MRTKVLSSRELWFSVETILYVKDAIRFRVNDLTSSFLVVLPGGTETIVPQTYSHSTKTI